MHNITGQAGQSIAELSQTIQEHIKSRTAWKIMFNDYCLVFLCPFQTGDSIQPKYPVDLRCLLCDQSFSISWESWILLHWFNDIQSWPCPRGVCHKVHLGHLSHLCVEQTPAGACISKITVCGDRLCSAKSLSLGLLSQDWYCRTRLDTRKDLHGFCLY